MTGEISEHLKITYDDYLRLPEDGRYEVLEGDLLMTPSPVTYHQVICTNLLLILGNHIRKELLGRIFVAPYDVVLSKYNVVQPDLIFVSRHREHIIGEKNIQGAPDMVVEVLSPGTRERDEKIKMKIYAKYGILEYWIVDPDNKKVAVYCWSKEGYHRQGSFSETETFTTELLPGLLVQCKDIFVF